MMVVSPARAEQRMVVRADVLAEAMEAVGTPAYAKACLRVFGESLDVDHWALFHYGPAHSLRCTATASRAYEAAAEQNISSFVSRCHKVDPALIMFRHKRRDTPCLIKMGIGDIYDSQYRSCFEATRVHERLSFFDDSGADVIQLCVYRAAATRTFSPPEMRVFATLARLVLATAAKHESFADAPTFAPRHLDVDAIERRLECLSGRLSKRERQVCARAVAGKTIVETATELGIERTSVVTYRQRAYEKLDIARQTDLLALVYEVRNERIQ